MSSTSSTARRPTAYRRSNTSINLDSASAAAFGGGGGGVGNSGLGTNYYASGLIDRYAGAAPSRDTVAVLNGGVSAQQTKDFLLGRNAGMYNPPPLPMPEDNLKRWSSHAQPVAPPPVTSHHAPAAVDTAYLDERARLSSFYPRQPKYSYLVNRTNPEYFGRRDDYLSYLTPSTYELPSAKPDNTYYSDIYQPPSPANAGADYGGGSGNSYADDAVLQRSIEATKKYNQIKKSKSYSNFDIMRRDQNQVSSFLNESLFILLATGRAVDFLLGGFFHETILKAFFEKRNSFINNLRSSS